MERGGMWVDIWFVISLWCTDIVPSAWRGRHKAWAIMRYLHGCIYWSPTVPCWMGELVGKSLTTVTTGMWRAEVKVWATFVIRFNDGILGDSHTHLLYDIPRLANVEIQFLWAPTKRGTIYITGTEEGPALYINVGWIIKHWYTERQRSWRE